MIVDQDMPLETSYYSDGFIHGNREIVRLMIQSNIDLLSRDEIGQSPVHYLAGNNNDSVIDELYGKKFDVDALNNYGETPLYCAASAGLPNTVEFLLNNGAKPNAQNFHSKSPLLAAFSSAKYMSIENRIRYRDVIELLLKYGADPQLQPPGFPDIFHIALEYHLLDLLETVIAHLALMEKQEMIIINEHNVQTIAGHPIMGNFLNICRQQLNILERIEVDDSLNLYKLLISSDLRIEKYARNSNMVAKIRSICRNEESYRPYGFKIQKNFERAVKMVKLKEKAALAFCDLTRLNYNASFIFVHQIIEYLGCNDLQNLCEV